MEDDLIIIFVHREADGKLAHRWSQWIRQHQLTEAIQAAGEMRMDLLYMGPGKGCTRVYRIRRSVAKRLGIPEWKEATG
jgi:hypothetical protein